MFIFRTTVLPSIAHRPDGSPFRMTAGQRKRANSLIRKFCCNYDNGKCLLLDRGKEGGCVQSISYSVICKWFRYSILPLDTALETNIFHIHDVKSCAVCGVAFQPKSNRSKYCVECAKIIHRQQKTTSERKRRANVDN